MHYNGAVAEYDSNEAGWVTEVRNLKSDRAVLSQSIYSYDAVGNPIGVVEASGDLVSWSYDEVYQLTFEERVGTGSYGLDYSYDGVGNRLTDFNGAVTTTYSYDEADQLNVVEGSSSRTTYSYDENGNTKSINAAGSYTTYSWDIENRPTKVELSDGTLNTIIYDGDGKRRRYEDAAGVRLFIWDGENILLQTTSAGATNRDYTYRPQLYGELVSQVGEVHHYDALGSTLLLTDASQNVVVSYRYRAFGEQTVVSGSSPNRFGWIGRLGYYRQPDTEDYWVRARVEEPSIGRWISRDPLPTDVSLLGIIGLLLRAEGPNFRAGDVLLGDPWYQYVRNRALAFVDPTGLVRICGCDGLDYLSLRLALAEVEKAVKKPKCKRAMKTVCGRLGNRLTDEERGPKVDCKEQGQGGCDAKTAAYYDMTTDRITMCRHSLGSSDQERARDLTHEFGHWCSDQRGRDYSPWYNFQDKEGHGEGYWLGDRCFPGLPRSFGVHPKKAKRPGRPKRRGPGGIPPGTSMGGIHGNIASHPTAI
jgi:YD repeat-containing protein